MRILMVAARYFPFVGGIETHLHEVGTRMVSLGHEVAVLTTDPTQSLPLKERQAGMRIRRVRAWPKHRDYYFAPGIYTGISRGQWDVIHFQGYSTFVAPIGLLAAIRRDIPFVLTFHSGGHSSPLRNAARGIQHALLAPLIARASRLIGVSEFEADFFSKRMGLDRDKFTVVPNGASLPPPTVTPAENGRDLIVSIGRLERYKGHHRVIAALPELLRRVPAARLKIVGSGRYERELRGLIRALRLDEQVTIESFSSAERQRLSNLLASAGLAVLLSEYEAHPVAVLEALSVRCAVLASDTSGLRELAQKGFCRSIPLDASPSAVAAVMAEQLQSEQQIPRLMLPDWDTCARELITIYEAVVKSAHRSVRVAGGDQFVNRRSELGRRGS